MGKRKKRKIFLILNWSKKVLLSLHIFYQTEGMCFIPKTDNDTIHLSKDVLGMLQVGF